MKRRSKPAEEYNEPSEPELLERMKRMPEPYRSYAAFEYLFGNRVTEGTPGKSKYKDKKTGADNIRAYPGLRKSDFSIENGWIEVQHIPTLKRKVRDVTKFYRDGYLFINGFGEEPFVDLLLAYLGNKNAHEILWKQSRKTQWHYCNKYLLIPPKVLRSMRAKKDAKRYKLGALELKEKYNWGSTDMPFHYARFNKDAMKKKMEEAANR